MIKIKLSGLESLTTDSSEKNFWDSINSTTINKAVKIKEQLNSQYHDYLGWFNWPNKYDKNEYKLMKESAKKLRSKIEVLLVIGIGGSYLGTQAADAMVRGLFPSDDFKLIYVGHTMSSTYTAQLQAWLKNKKYGICVISKSGTTIEPAIAFRLFERDLITKVGQEACKELIVAVTDQNQGTLKKIADKKGYQTFVIPNDIGGRFSVLTPVGIYPLMVAQVDTDKIFFGAQQAMSELEIITGETEWSILLNNPAYQYAVIRYELNKSYGYKVESLISYELQMHFFTEWWKQLFGESEGKSGEGILPINLIFSTDLHSLGQWIQEGTKGLLFETILDFQSPTDDLEIPHNENNYDQLNYLVGKKLSEINRLALKGTTEAHVSAHVPNVTLKIAGGMDAQTFGYLVYFFELAAAISACLLEVNPFNQPGVEVYKKNMFRLLEK